MEADELAHVAACQKGELDHFDPLYTKHVDAIYKYLYRRTLVKEVAEDLTSITFIKALEGIRSFNPRKGELRAWLYRIARNSLTDHYRSPASKTVAIESVWDLESEELSTLDAERAMNAKKLHEALKHLSPSQREVVLLRMWEGLSYKEIAALTGKTEGNAKVLYSRSLDELRKHIPALSLLILFPHLL
jgi:RNA polymerase sigma-70 factor (ECF subfamily)